MKQKNNNRYFIVFGLVVLIGWWGYINLMNQRIEDMELDKLNNEINLASTEIQSMLVGKLMVFDMIYTHVSQNLDQEISETMDEFDAYGETNTIQEKGFVSFNIAPQGIIEYVYPEIGNEMVLGQNLLSDSRPQIREDIIFSINTGERFISGPIELLRGGTGLIIREPIYRDSEFWGLVSAIIDLNVISSILEKYNDSGLYSFALVDNDGQLILGDEAVIESEKLLKGKIIEGIDLKVQGAYSSEVSLHNRSLLNFFTYGSITMLFLILGAFYWILAMNSRLGRKLKKIVYYDSLTSLPNRRSLHEEIDSLMKENKQFHLAFIDLDDFKNINDTLGHTFGDKVLKVAAQRFIRPNHSQIRSYRWGGDEFVLIFENQEKPVVIEEIEEIISVFNRPIVIDESEFILSLSIGIVSYPLDSVDEDDLIKKADMLMYTIKHTSKNAYCFYEMDMEAEIIDKIHLSNMMKSNRFINQLRVFYQPKIDIVTEEVVGMEALARWEVEGKLISPNQFIPIAEANGKIGIIDRQIIYTALVDTKRLNRYREKPLKVSVNISGMNLNKEFIEYFKEQVHYIGNDPSNIEVEVTENYDINSVSRVIEILDDLIEYGVSIAIDDFGQGYAALNYLLKFPASTIKIDKEFVQNINQPVGDKIIQSIMSLANLLGKKVVAEGVETVEQLAYLTQIKCNEYQGFIYSEPIEYGRFKEMIK